MRTSSADSIAPTNPLRSRHDVDRASNLTVSGMFKISRFPWRGVGMSSEITFFGLNASDPCLRHTRQMLR